ncbi:GNAT family N-acetyltransferase [Amorphus sp. 3PC139-8]|uniref:GNAT family N-acetyltransferase n=1 Tax=Amorphus sp. 3PC139-8 TaxID=2735676 RepID=UPI00345C82A7
MIGYLFTPTPKIIEEAGPDDVAAIAAIHARSFPQEWTVDELAALLSKPGVAALVARRGSLWTSTRPVGFVIYRLAADEAEILTIAVSPSHRGAGVGANLVGAALRRLYSDRAARVFLEVDAENAAALAIYRRFGFQIVGQRPAYYGHADGRKGLALVMRCDLG